MNFSLSAQTNFLDNQLKFERVKKAHDEKWSNLKKDLLLKGFNENYQILMNAYKSEGKLQVWLKKPNEIKFKLFKTYSFCKNSGTLGPKLIEGDLQTPEGFYQINVFNPLSNFHLSFGVDYPNRVDFARMGKNSKLGGDIYIHGNCVTVGCIPLTDDKIKEVYLLAVFTKNGGQNDIPVNIFPYKMTDANLKKYGCLNPKQIDFWSTLQPVYLSFGRKKTLPMVTQAEGKYVIKVKYFRVQV